MTKFILEAHGLIKAFGERTVLKTDTLRIEDGARIALVGENGAGKSTLLAILSGELTPDAGVVIRHGACAHIHQWGDAPNEGDAHMRAVFRAPQTAPGLSGGEMTRRRLAASLSGQVPLLLADEPTTDLDADGTAQLTRMLDAYRGALVLVSHDRALLDALCHRVWHVEDGAVHEFAGTYAQYRAELQRRRAFAQFEYEQYQAEKARLKAMAQQKAEWAASVIKAPRRMGNSEARLHKREYTDAVIRQSGDKRKILDRIERLEKKERPRPLPDIQMALGMTTPIAAKTAVAMRISRLTAGNKTLLAQTALALPTGSKTALMGANGSGKTTLLRVLQGAVPPGIGFTGHVSVNPAVRMGFFCQNHAEMLDESATVLDNVLTSQRQEAAARTVLARLNLRGDAVFKPVRVLSGGEKAKTALAKLLLSDLNLLVLDEPTNHLDIFTMEALEALLRAYGGTLLVTSHDRAFVSAVANRIAAITPSGITAFEGPLIDMEEENRRSEAAEKSQLAISALDMRLAALAARMAAPKKGDRHEVLSAEYEALAAQRHRLKQQDR